MAAALPMPTWRGKKFDQVTKLAGLLIKTLAKPLSKRIKHEFSRYEFTQRILIGIGQTSHRFTSRLTIWSAGYKVRSIKDLEEDKALVTGAEFVGETFLLLVSGGLVLYEYNNSNEKARLKDEKYKTEVQAERDDLRSKLHAIDVRLKALEVVVKNNSNSLLSLGQHKYVPPNEEELVPLDQFPSEETNKRTEEVHESKGATKLQSKDRLTQRIENNIVGETEIATAENTSDIAHASTSQSDASNVTEPWWSRLRPW